MCKQGGMWRFAGLGSQPGASSRRGCAACIGQWGRSMGRTQEQPNWRSQRCPGPCCSSWPVLDPNGQSHCVSRSQHPAGSGELVQESASYKPLGEAGRQHWEAKILNIINCSLKGVHSGVLGTRMMEKGTPEGRFGSHGALGRFLLSTVLVG